MTTYNTVYELTYALINEIGLSTSQDGALFDQDTHNQLAVGGKYIKCSIDPRRPAYPSDMSIVLDPLNDIRTMIFIMSYYFSKEEMMNNRKILTYAFQESFTSKLKTNVIVKIEGQGSVESRFYYNKCLKICDIILRLGGYDDLDLSNFDQIPEE